MTISVATPRRAEDDHSFADNTVVQQWFNDDWLRALVTWGYWPGKGAQEDRYGASFIFGNFSPSIPPKAIINSASIRGVSDQTQVAGLSCLIEAVEPDGRWDADPVPARWIRQSATTAFRSHCEATMYDGGATLLVSSGLIASTLARHAQVRRYTTPARHQRFGQKMLAGVSGTLASAAMRMFAFSANAPYPGDIWMEVYSVNPDLTTGALLATSDKRPFSSIAVGGGGMLASPGEVFTFSGANQISIVAGTNYALVVTGDWIVNGVDYLVVKVSSSNAVPSYSWPISYGEGRGLCEGNYIGGYEPLELPILTGSPSLSWAAPSVTQNVAYQTRDISELVSAFVNRAGYAEGDPMMFRIRPVSFVEQRWRGFYAFANANTPAPYQYPTLTVDWDAPVSVSVDGLIGVVNRLNGGAVQDASAVYRGNVSKSGGYGATMATPSTLEGKMQPTGTLSGVIEEDDQ